MCNLGDYTYVFLLSLQDSFYHNLKPEELKKVHEYNFDHPGGYCLNFGFYISLSLVTWSIDISLQMSILFSLLILYIRKILFAFLSCTSNSQLMLQRFLLFVYTYDDNPIPVSCLS